MIKNKFPILKIKQFLFIVGDWRNGKREGKGIYYWKNGNRIMGDYSNNEPIRKHEKLTKFGKVTEVIYQIKIGFCLK